MMNQQRCDICLDWGLADCERCGDGANKGEGETLTTKEWLNRGWKLSREIRALTEAKEKALSEACGTTSVLTDIKVQSSMNNTSEKKMTNYADYSDELDKHRNELLKIKTEIMLVIRKVDNSTYRTLLIERYINHKIWEQIAVDMNYSYKHITRLHGYALEKIKML